MLAINRFGSFAQRGILRYNGHIGIKLDDRNVIQLVVQTGYINGLSVTHILFQTDIVAFYGRSFAPHNTADATAIDAEMRGGFFHRRKLHRPFPGTIKQNNVGAICVATVLVMANTDVRFHVFLGELLDPFYIFCISE